MDGFGKKLRDLRGDTKQTEAAAELGIKYSTYAMYEVDRREPSFETLVAIAKHYGVSTDYLLGLTECKSPDIDEQAICKKTGLWYDTVKKLIDIQCSQRAAIIGDDPEGLCSDDDIPQWMYDAFAIYINLFILNHDTPYLASKSYHVVAEINKGRSINMETLDKARNAAADIDPNLHVMSPHESEIFFRHRVEWYARKITSQLIIDMYSMLPEGEENAET